MASLVLPSRVVDDSRVVPHVRGDLAGLVRGDWFSVGGLWRGGAECQPVGRRSTRPPIGASPRVSDSNLMCGYLQLLCKQVVWATIYVCAI